MEYNQLTMETISELIDKLVTVNIKLFNVMDKNAELSNKKDKTGKDLFIAVQLCEDNVNLAKTRSALKSEIDKKLNDAIKNGKTEVLNECKDYGK
jgi:hypothetical protein